jgi:hypothetical protein
MSAAPQAIAPNPHTNLLNVYIQIANKMGLKNYFYVTLAKNYWLFKVYLLEFDIGRLGKIWIQHGRRESKKVWTAPP